MREKRDPIEHLAQKLISEKIASEDELKSVDKETRAVVNAAAEFATASPEPDPAELYSDILV